VRLAENSASNLGEEDVERHGAFAFTLSFFDQTKQGDNYISSPELSFLFEAKIEETEKGNLSFRNCFIIA
jgi:hypothetical protein